MGDKQTGEDEAALRAWQRLMREAFEVTGRADGKMGQVLDDRLRLPTSTRPPTSALFDTVREALAVLDIDVTPLPARIEPTTAWNGRGSAASRPGRIVVDRQIRDALGETIEAHVLVDIRGLRVSLTNIDRLPVGTPLLAVLEAEGATIIAEGEVEGDPGHAELTAAWPSRTPPTEIFLVLP